MKNKKNNIEEITNNVANIAIDVYKKLGLGHANKIYEGAIAYALRREEIKYSWAPVIMPSTNGQLERRTILFNIDDSVICEVESISAIISVYEDQMMAYLRDINYRVGIVLNYGSKKFEIKRLINITGRSNQIRDTE